MSSRGMAAGGIPDAGAKMRANADIAEDAAAVMADVVDAAAGKKMT